MRRARADAIERAELARVAPELLLASRLLRERADHARAAHTPTDATFYDGASSTLRSLALRLDPRALTPDD
ncbi:MAG TPA: hypothetical protein VMM35_07885, partial [Longimicrobiales bacterium]|nr:hypothetical protein [Longimicrobiales bacterium]